MYGQPKEVLNQENAVLVGETLCPGRLPDYLSPRQLRKVRNDGCDGIRESDLHRVGRRKERATGLDYRRS